MRALTALSALALACGPAAAQSDPFTDTAGGVRPALKEICSRSPAEVRDPRFVTRMAARFGFDAEAETFLRTGDDGKLVVVVKAEGCAITMEGERAMIARADKALRDFASAAGLTGQVSDEEVSGEEGHRNTRERSAPGRGSLSWLTFDNYNGYNKPSRLSATWTRP